MRHRPVLFMACISLVGNVYVSMIVSEGGVLFGHDSSLCIVLSSKYNNNVHTAKAIAQDKTPGHERVLVTLFKY